MSWKLQKKFCSQSGNLLYIACWKKFVWFDRCNLLFRQISTKEQLPYFQLIRMKVVFFVWLKQVLKKSFQGKLYYTKLSNICLLSIGFHLQVYLPQSRKMPRKPLEDTYWLFFFVPIHSGNFMTKTLENPVPQLTSHKAFEGNGEVNV